MAPYLVFSVWHALEPSAKNGGGPSSGLSCNVGPLVGLCKIRSHVRLDFDRESGLQP
jgi:hypothetical protein